MHLTKQFYIIVLITFITICSWVIFDIVHTRSQVEISPSVQQLIQPLDPNFDLSVLDH